MQDETLLAHFHMKGRIKCPPATVVLFGALSLSAWHTSTTYGATLPTPQVRHCLEASTVANFKEVTVSFFSVSCGFTLKLYVYMFVEGMRSGGPTAHPCRQAGMH
jgi:hypothetical protein